MPIVKFTAKRSLASGISLNDEVTMAVKLRRSDGLTRGRTVEAERRTSLGGRREMYYHRADVSWAAVSIPISGTDVARMVMFLDSVESAETFEFAPYDSVGDSPIDWRDCILEPSGYTETREVPTGSSGNADYFSYAFRIVELP